VKLFLLGALIFSNIWAVTIVKKNNDIFELKKKKFEIKEIFDDYARVRSLNIIYSTEVEGRIYLYGVKEIKKKDLDLYISAVAAEGGYTLIRNEELNQIEVINSRDIRYKATKLFQNISDVPDTYNHYKFLVKLNYVKANELSRNMRPFMSRYGRIIDENNANSLIISDSGKNIHRLHKIIQELDKKSYLKRVASVDDFNEKHKKKIIKKESILSLIKDQHILFLIAFSLMGGIIGFGISTHLNRKKMEW
jgi:type II secretory pathway component GspD/PulD (secretin)